jgi:hypothetical protein
VHADSSFNHDERDFVAARILPVIEQRKLFARSALEPS